MRPPIKVAVTGAAGNIAYSIIFRIAAGDMLGQDQPIILHLLEIEPAMEALSGVVMELDDCAYPLLMGIKASSNPNEAFDDVDIAMLVGSRPRSKGMERKDLLEANAAIFSEQGKALNDSAKRSVRVMVVGNPANTNALIAMNNAPDLSPQQFTSMTRLDHLRAKTQLAHKVGLHHNDVTNMTIWGNHSTTQYPDIYHAKVRGQTASELVNDKWISDVLIPEVQTRGAAIINARGASSAASAAEAAIMHVHDWVLGSAPGDWVSMGVRSNGEYGIEEGLVYSFPVICNYGDYCIVEGLDINEFSQERMSLSEQELVEERDAIKHLL